MNLDKIHAAVAADRTAQEFAAMALLCDGAERANLKTLAREERLAALFLLQQAFQKKARR